MTLKKYKSVQENIPDIQKSTLKNTIDYTEYKWKLQQNTYKKYNILQEIYLKMQRNT